jgi:hypothetical protein
LAIGDVKAKIFYDNFVVGILTVNVAFSGFCEVAILSKVVFPTTLSFCRFQGFPVLRIICAVRCEKFAQLTWIGRLTAVLRCAEFAQ